MTSIKFNAGKVQYDEDTKRCTPLPHKGIITIKPNSEEEEFFDFVWSPKSSSGNVVEDELLIIPGDVSFKKVESCKTGRVFALTFLSSGAKYLYWLQDVGDDEELSKLTEKDQLLVNKIQDIITPSEEEEEEEEQSEEPAAAPIKEEPEVSNMDVDPKE